MYRVHQFPPCLFLIFRLWKEISRKLFFKQEDLHIFLKTLQAPVTPLTSISNPTQSRAESQSVPLRLQALTWALTASSTEMGAWVSFFFNVFNYFSHTLHPNCSFPSSTLPSTCPLTWVHFSVCLQKESRSPKDINWTQHSQLQQD